MATTCPLCRKPRERVVAFPYLPPLGIVLAQRIDPTWTLLSPLLLCVLMFSMMGCPPSGAPNDEMDGSGHPEGDSDNTGDEGDTAGPGDTNGDADSENNVPPLALFTAFPTEGVTPFVVQFFDESVPGSSPIVEWDWAISDATSVEQNPTITFLAVGFHDATLTVRDANGLEDSITLDNLILAHGATVGVGQYLGMFIFAQDSDAQYLGKVSTIPFDSDSIINEFGAYGSQFSSTSIRNSFSQYGSEFGQFSAYNQFTQSPPIIVYFDGEDVVLSAYLTKKPRVGQPWALRFVAMASFRRLPPPARGRWS